LHEISRLAEEHCHFTSKIVFYVSIDLRRMYDKIWGWKGGVAVHTIYKWDFEHKKNAAKNRYY
jgi:hypothetical protein